jgi:sporulation protein YlmC with PRC-barrel domain
MGDVAGWIAPIATMVAAVMTALNLGSRITGWGFVVFAIGSVAWIAVAISTGQNNLLLTNGFLTFVNIVGIWRWLGRRATYDEGARRAEQASARDVAPNLFQLGGMEGRAVTDVQGRVIGHVVDVMAENESGKIAYAVVREGSEIAVHDRLHAVAWRQLSIDGECVMFNGTEDLSALPLLQPDQWPSRLPA